VPAHKWVQMGVVGNEHATEYATGNCGKLLRRGGFVRRLKSGGHGIGVGIGFASTGLRTDDFNYSEPAADARSTNCFAGAPVRGRETRRTYRCLEQLFQSKALSPLVIHLIAQS